VKSALAVLIVLSCLALNGLTPPVQSGNLTAQASSQPEKEKQEPNPLLPFGDISLRPGARIKQLTFSPDGQHLASLGNSLYMEDRFSSWDVKTGQEDFTVSLREGWLGQQAWANNSSSFFLFQDHEKTGPAAFQIINPQHSSDGQKALVGYAPSGSGLQTFRVAIAGGNPAPPPETFSTFLFSGNSQVLFAFRSGGTNPTGVVAFRTEACDSGNRLQRIKELTHSQMGTNCTGLAWAPLTKQVLVLTGGGNSDQAQNAFTFDLESGQMRRSISLTTGTTQGKSQTFDFSADGNRLAIGKEDGVIDVFDTSTGKLLIAAKKHEPPPSGNRWQSAVSAVKFVQNGKAVLSAGRDERQIVWETDTGKDIAVLNGHRGWVEAIAVSPDERLVATAGQDSLIRLWDATTWKPVLSPQGHFGSIWNLVTTPDGKCLITDGGDQTIRFWDIATGKEIRAVPTGRRWAKGLSMTPRGDAVLHRGENQDLISIDVGTGAVTTLPTQGTPLAFSSDGQLFATSVDNGTKVWNWRNSKELCLIPLKVSTALFTEENKLLLAMRENNAQACVLVDPLTGKELGKLDLQTGYHRNMIGRSLDPDRVYACKDRAKVAQLSLNRRAVEREFEPAPTKSGNFYLIGFAVSSDGRLVATGNSDGSVTIYESASGQIRDTFYGHRQGVFTVAFTPDARRVISAGEGHSVLLWDISLQNGATAALPWANGEMQRVWDGLGTEHARTAKATMARFAATPQESVEFLGNQLKPAAEIRVDVNAKIQQIVQDLDSSSFATREQANKELNQLGNSAFEEIRKLAKESHSPEVIRRLNGFLTRFEVAENEPNNIREARAIEILEAINSPESRRLLVLLSQGAKSATRTKRAQAALQNHRQQFR
jgi:WD40 repeat protein